MEAIDHTNTIALLIGVSEFPQDKTINPIPNVVANLTNFRKTLLSPVVGVPEANITVSMNESRSQIEKKLRARQ